MMLLWTNWVKNGSKSDQGPQERRNVLFSRFTLIAALVAFAHVAQDFIQHVPRNAMYDGSIALVILIFHVLHRNGKQLVSKVSLLFFLNVSMVTLCSLIPKHNGVYLFFFPLIGLSSVVFDFHHRHWGFFFVALSTTFLVALVLSDFKLLGDISITSIPEKKSFLINLSSSALILMVCINFMMRYNDQSERRLKKLAEEVGQQNAKLEKTNSELDRFVYSASHDLRAPLLSIQGIVNLAQYENKNVHVQEYLQMINGQVSKLDLFIRDIISYSHNSRTEIAEQPVNFNHLLDGIKDNLTFMNGAERIKWVKDIEEGEWIADKGRIVTVLNNLVSNAIKFHNLSLEDPWIRVAVKRNVAGCQIIVKDNGVGIPQEHQQKVFEMFYRAHDNASGSGLGLYIVKEIVMKMNGSIHLQSQVGHGSTFTIYLPVIAA